MEGGCILLHFACRLYFASCAENLFSARAEKTKKRNLEHANATWAACGHNDGHLTPTSKQLSPLAFPRRAKSTLALEHYVGETHIFDIFCTCFLLSTKLKLSTQHSTLNTSAAVPTHFYFLIDPQNLFD
jgi:hypothetical protein